MRYTHTHPRAHTHCRRGSEKEEEDDGRRKRYKGDNRDNKTLMDLYHQMLCSRKAYPLNCLSVCLSRGAGGIGGKGVLERGIGRRGGGRGVTEGGIEVRGRGRGGRRGGRGEGRTKNTSLSLFFLLFFLSLSRKGTDILRRRLIFHF